MCGRILAKLSSDHSSDVEETSKSHCSGRFYTFIKENRLILFINLIILIGIVISCDLHFPKETPIIVGSAGAFALLVVNGLYLCRRKKDDEAKPSEPLPIVPASPVVDLITLEPFFEELLQAATIRKDWLLGRRNACKIENSTLMTIKDASFSGLSANGGGVAQLNVSFSAAERQVYTLQELQNPNLDKTEQLRKFLRNAEREFDSDCSRQAADISGISS